MTLRGFAVAFLSFSMAAISVGCSGGAPQPQLAPPASEQNTVQSDVSAAVTGVRSAATRTAVAQSPHRDRGRSWMAPEAKKKNLLYVSDYGSGDVSVLAYPSGKVVGTLTGFSAPHGDCVDNAGNVWITDELASEILEYAHGGTSPIATLSDSGEYPVDCSVDPTTGNLAVSNTETTGQGPGDVAVYPDAQGMPTTYSDSAMPHVFYLGYDNHGDLFVDGENSDLDEFEFAELPNGSSSLTNITLNKSIEFAGGVQWDGKYVAVGDQGNAVIYQTNGAGGEVEGSTPLTGSSEVSDFWIQAKRVVGPDLGNNMVEFWKYPKGGSPTKALSGFDEPIGATVSLSKK